MGDSMNGVAHLLGKRTGRPRGSRTAPKGLLAARWAMKRLDSEGAVPPSPLAGALLRLGREHPDRLAALVDELEAMARPEKSVNQPPAQTTTAPPAPVQAPLASTAPRRVRKLLLNQKQLAQFWANAPVTWVQKLPENYKVVGDIEVRRSLAHAQFILLLESEKFGPVAEGAPAPELTPGTEFNWK